MAQLWEEKLRCGCKGSSQFVLGVLVRATGDRRVEVAFTVIRGGEFEDLTQVWFLLLCRGLILMWTLILVVSFLFDFDVDSVG